MYCSRCGKEIMNEAIICPNCGCATSNYTPKSNNCSEDYIAIREFLSKATTIKTLGIIAAVLCLGIGIIFSIIIMILLRRTVPPKITTTNPKEIADFELAQRRLRLGRILAYFPIVIFIICLFVIIISGAWSYYIIAQFL